MLSPVTLGETTNKALDAEPPIASFVKSMLICGGPVNAVVRQVKLKFRQSDGHFQSSSGLLGT